MPIKLLKNRSDIGAGTRGSDLGIDALEIAAINQNNDFFIRYPHLDIETHNETIYQKNTNSFAKRIEHVAQQCNRVCEAVYQTLQDGFFPIVLSGDHSSALGTISGIKKANQNKRLGVIWIDAHADIHSPYTSPSGNIHGMPLAAALHLDHLDLKINEVSPETSIHWSKLKNLGLNSPKILPSDLVYLGLRDFEPAEKSVIDSFQLSHYRVEDLRSTGLENILTEMLEKLKSVDLLYISFDVDSMDCDQISYGTGTPVKSGFLPEEIQLILDRFFSTQKVACLEVAEINPLLDNKGNKMAETAFELLSYIEQKHLTQI